MAQNLRPYFYLPALVGALVLPACKHGGGKSSHEAQAADPSQVVAKVDDTVITVSDVQDRINKQSPFVRARFTNADRKKEFVDGMVRFEVLAAEAARRGYDKDPDVQRVMKQQMISKLMQKDFESKLKVEDVPDADVEKYYNEHPTEFHQKDEVRVSEVLVKDKAKADKVAKEAQALPKTPPLDQKGFHDLVTKYSEDEESKPRGGDLSFFAADSAAYPKPLVEAAFKLKDVGDVSPPVKIERGWAIIRLTQKRPGFNRSLPEVKHQVQQRLFRDLRSKAQDTFVEDLKKKTSIEINDANLAKVVVEAGPTGSTPPGGVALPGMPPTAVGAPPPGTPAVTKVQPAGAPPAPNHP
jgi:peptidyl-prolyl cis-trans isomerase C